MECLELATGWHRSNRALEPPAKSAPKWTVKTGFNAKTAMVGSIAHAWVTHKKNLSPWKEQNLCIFSVTLAQWTRDNLPKDNFPKNESGKICRLIFGKLSFTFGKLAFGKLGLGNMSRIRFLLL